MEGQLGLEKTPEEYVANMVKVFEQVKRVLKKEGTCFLNLGDSYNGSGGAGGDYNAGGLKEGQPKYGRKFTNKLKPKDLVGIPWMVAFALRSAEWYLRQDIIWHKPNPMPESVTDRCTKSHEYIFLLSKSLRYYYDAEAIKEQIKSLAGMKTPDGWDTGKGGHGRFHKNGREKGHKGYKPRPSGVVRDRLLDYDSKEKQLRPQKQRGGFEKEGDLPAAELKANKRSVWTINTRPYSEAHFATFPELLIEPCIKAGCPEGGIVLDPFMGAGTTAIVARKLNRDYVGIELNQEYIDIAEKRIFNEIGLFQ